LALGHVDLQFYSFLMNSLPIKPDLAFEVWKAHLQEDCRRVHKLLILDNCGDYVLAMLWSRGIEPTVQAIIEDGDSVSMSLPPTDA
jgi:hypothetical protein